MNIDDAKIGISFKNIAQNYLKNGIAKMQRRNKVKPDHIQLNIKRILG